MTLYRKSQGCLSDRIAAVLSSIIALSMLGQSATAVGDAENYDDWEPDVRVSAEPATQKTVPLPGFKEFSAAVRNLSSPVGSATEKAIEKLCATWATAQRARSPAGRAPPGGMTA